MSTLFKIEIYNLRWYTFDLATTNQNGTNAWKFYWTVNDFYDQYDGRKLRRRYDNKWTFLLKLLSSKKVPKIMNFLIRSKMYVNRLNNYKAKGPKRDPSMTKFVRTVKKQTPSNIE